MGGARPVLKGTAEEMRNQFSGLNSFLATQRTRTWNDLTVKDESINGIAIRIYIPNSFEREHAPVGVFYHSGGFVVGDLDSEDDVCRTISADANIAVISVDYRLSPEHKAPAQLEDALAIFEWVSLTRMQYLKRRNRILNQHAQYRYTKTRRKSEYVPHECSLLAPPPAEHWP